MDKKRVKILTQIFFTGAVLWLLIYLLLPYINFYLLGGSSPGDSFEKFNRYSCNVFAKEDGLPLCNAEKSFTLISTAVFAILTIICGLYYKHLNSVNYIDKKWVKIAAIVFSVFAIISLAIYFLAPYLLFYLLFGGYSSSTSFDDYKSGCNLSIEEQEKKLAELNYCPPNKMCNLVYHTFPAAGCPNVKHCALISAAIFAILTIASGLYYRHLNSLKR